MSDATCPYCDKDTEIIHDDGYGYDENETFEQQCGFCDKNFVYTTSISFYYSTDKADCLNGGKHKYEPSKTYPRCFVEMVCTECDTKRKPTEEEMAEHKIPTYQEYLQEMEEIKEK